MPAAQHNQTDRSIETSKDAANFNQLMGNNAKLDKTLPLPTVDLMNQFKYMKSPAASKTIRHPSGDSILQDEHPLQKTPADLFKERKKLIPEPPVIK